LPLFLREQDVERLLTLEETIPLVEEAFRLYGLGQAINPPRQKSPLAHCELRVMSAAVPGLGFGLKTYTMGKKGLRFAVLLYNEETGDLEAIIEGNNLGKMRTAAVTSIATNYLARPDATTFGLFGSGWQASSQLRAVCTVRPIEYVWVYSLTPEHRQRFAEEMVEKLGISIKSVNTPRDALANADIVTTVTSAKEPLFNGKFLQPGTHINAIGCGPPPSQEIDTETVRRANLIVIDDLKQCSIENGDLITAVRRGVIAWEDVVELGQLITGQVRGRQDNDAITLFESQGIAIQDLAAARQVYNKAVEKGIGEKLPTTILAD
jgi:ornithine cyclodeaminase/alanine dehydrogenase-like protein (mu-crystallin family)